MATILIIFGLLLALAAIIGSILPVIPGPSISLLSLVILSWAKDWEPFSMTFLVIMALITILVSILDYVVPAAGAKKFGASNTGICLSIIGMLAGFLFFPPFGMIIGAFLGALAGELFAGKRGKTALRAGWGVLLGNVAATGLKLAFTGTVLFFYIKEMF